MGRSLVASAARTASGNSGAISGAFDNLQAASFLLDVTAAATDAGDTLDVYIQSSNDGTIWDDFIHFTQVLGNGGVKQFIAKWVRTLTPERELGAPQDAAMAAGVAQGPVGGIWRVKWVIVDAGTPNVSFTFSVTMQGLRG